MQDEIKVSLLKEHPKNSYYFDDIEGDGWEDFLKSVKTSGITNAISIDQHNYIISGHQRFRAAKLLGMKTIPYHRITYTEDELASEYPKDVKDLIESNLKQRVAGNANPIKLGKCIQFLEGYYGIQHGSTHFQGNQHTEVNPNNSDSPKTQSDLAEELGISVDTLRNYKLLADMIPEIQDLVDTGIVTKTTALSIVKQMTEDEQRQLAEMLPKDEKVSSREVEYYKKRIKELSDENQTLKDAPKEQVTVEVTKEVVPEDYEDLKTKLQASEERIKELRTAMLEAPEGYVSKGAYKDLAQQFNTYKVEHPDEHVGMDSKSRIAYLEADLEDANEEITDLKAQLAAKEEELTVAKEATAKAKLSLHHPKEVEAAAHSNIIESVVRVDALLKSEVAKILEDDELVNCSDVVKNKVEKLSNLMVSLATQLARALGTQDAIDVEVIDTEVVA